MPICKTSIAKHKPENVKCKFADYLDLPVLIARLRCPFPWPIPVGINVMQARVPLLWMTPVSASLAHIFVPYPGPVALFRTPVLNPDPKKVIRAGKLSP